LYPDTSNCTVIKNLLLWDQCSPKINNGVDTCDVNLLLDKVQKKAHNPGVMMSLLTGDHMTL